MTASEQSALRVRDFSVGAVSISLLISLFDVISLGRRGGGGGGGGGGATAGGWGKGGGRYPNI